MIITEIIYSTTRNKCPRCHEGRIFENNFAYNLNNGLKMKEHCSHCQLKYERENGFFYGAMYVSYALMSAILIIAFVSDLLWVHLDAIVLATSITSAMLLLFPLVYRWARIIWLNFFVRYDKCYVTKKHRHY